MKYGIDEHTADLIFWVEANSLEGLFRDAPLALARLMLGGKAKGALCRLEIRLEAEDRIGLMVQLLNEVVYQLEVYNLAAVEHAVTSLTPTGLQSTLGLVELEPGRRFMGEPVKAATYHRASLGKNGEVWRMSVTLDV